jgi:hypothetical protein
MIFLESLKKTFGSATVQQRPSFDPLLRLAKTVCDMQKSVIKNSRKIQERNREQEKAIRTYRESTLKNDLFLKRWLELLKKVRK